MAWNLIILVFICGTEAEVVSGYNSESRDCLSSEQNSQIFDEPFKNDILK